MFWGALLERGRCGPHMRCAAHRGGTELRDVAAGAGLCQGTAQGPRGLLGDGTEKSELSAVICGKSGLGCHAEPQRCGGVVSLSSPCQVLEGVGVGALLPAGLCRLGVQLVPG